MQAGWLWEGPACMDQQGQMSDLADRAQVIYVFYKRADAAGLVPSAFHGQGAAWKPPGDPQAC